MKRPLLLVLSALLVLACASEKERPSEDSLLAVEAIGLADGMRDTYLKKNSEGLRKFCVPEACDDILRDMGRFKTEELEFTPQWVQIKQDGSVQLKVSWKGRWTHKNGRKEDRGLAVFELTGRPLRLRGISGSSPFVGPYSPE
jgi:hypothetical protein